MKRLNTVNVRIMLILHSSCSRAVLVCYSDECEFHNIKEKTYISTQWPRGGEEVKNDMMQDWYDG